MKKTLLFLIPLSFALPACTDDEEDKPADIRKPGIDINAPTYPDTVFVTGQQIPIKVFIADNDKLKDIHVAIKSLTDTLTDIHYTRSPNVSTAFIDTTIVINVSSQQTFLLRIDAEDISGNAQFKSQEFMVIPE